MKVTADVMVVEGGESVLSLYAWPEHDEGVSGDGIKMVRSGSSFALEQGFLLEDLHPDLYALAVLTNFAPYIKNRLELDVGVSHGFAELVYAELGIGLHPVDARLTTRAPSPTARDALAFSGGADSCAALYLMPFETVPVFLHRVKPYFLRNKKTLYKAEAAIHTCEQVAKDGYDVKLCRTTAEYVRNPVGFTLEWTTITSAILQADSFDIRSFSFGMIGEEAIRIGYSNFDSILERPLFKSWQPLFSHVGLPLGLPTAGLSEVSTSRIVAEHVPHWQAQSCIRGAVGAPCLNCPKCFRKLLLEKRVTCENVEESFYDMAYKRSVRAHLSTDPVLHLENIYAYSLHGMRSVSHPVYQALRNKTAAVYEYGEGMNFLEGHYTPMLHAMPDFLKTAFENKLYKHVRPMSSKELEIVEGWDLSFIPSQSKNITRFTELVDALNAGAV